MSSLTNFMGLQILSPAPSGPGGLAIQNDFVDLVTWNPKSVWNQTSSPGSGNDNTQSFFPGSLWFQTSPTTTLFICTSSGTGTATWVPAFLVAYDTTPKLGGNLNVNGMTITSTSGGNIVISPSSGGLTGIGTSSPNSVLQVGGALSTALATKTGTYTVTATDSIVLCNAATGAFTVTLISAVGVAGRQYTFKRLNSGANNVTVAASGAQTIDGAATQVLTTQYQAIRVVSDGTNWDLV